MKSKYFSFALLFISFLFSCSSTRITSSWKAENLITNPYHNVMVWGILTEKDSLLRENMETQLVNDLIEKGYHAISSMHVYGNKAYNRLSEREIVDEFKNTGVDAVITLVLLNKEKENIYLPPAVEYKQASSFDRIEKYYSTVYDKIITPGYYVTTTNYFWESNLFEVADDKLIYSVKTKSFNPSSTEKLAHENGASILKNMIKKKIILDRMPKED